MSFEDSLVQTGY